MANAFVFRDDELILICAFRYALGRQSYIVGCVVDDIISNWQKLSDHTKKLIRSEIKDAIQQKSIGMEMDLKEWERILQLL